MKISRDMNLVIPIDRADDYLDADKKPGKAYAHAAPISFEVFERWHLICGRVFAEIMAGGLGIAAGPRIAASILKRQCEIAGVWEGQDGAELGLMGEMLRLANVTAQDNNGRWVTLPWDQAINGDLLFDEDVSEVRNALVFFTVHWRMHKRNQRQAMMTSAVRLWGGALTSFNITEYANSLPTPTRAANTGEKPEAEMKISRQPI